MTTGIILFLAGLFTAIGTLVGWCLRGFKIEREMPEFWRWKMRNKHEDDWANYR